MPRTARLAAPAVAHDAFLEMDAEPGGGTRRVVGASVAAPTRSYSETSDAVPIYVESLVLPNPSSNSPRGSKKWRYALGQGGGLAKGGGGTTGPFFAYLKYHLLKFPPWLNDWARSLRRMRSAGLGCKGRNSR